MANHYSGKRAAGRKPVGKRALSLLMALVMSLSLVQITAFAVEEITNYRVVEQGTEVSDNAGLVTIKKTATHKTDDQFDINLSLTVKKTEETTVTNNPAHIVLVMDRSNSMEENSGRFANARKAAKTFVSALLKGNDTENDNGNRIAVVGFGTKADTGTAFSNDVEKLNGWIESATKAYKNSDDGGTNIQAGIHEAQRLLKNDGFTGKKIIVVFSDGMPTYSYRYVNTAEVTKCHIEWFPPYEHVVDKYELTGIWHFDYNDRVGSGSGYGYRDDFWNNDYPYVSYTCKNHRWEKTGYITVKDDLKTNGDATIAEAKIAKDNGTEIYSVYLGGSDEQQNKNALETMKGIVSDAEKNFLSTNKMEDLAKLFGQIAQTITTETSGLKVSDPMGDFITLGNVQALVDAGVITLAKDGRSFTWILANTPAANVTEDKTAGTTTYTLTYPVTLNAAAPEFESGKAYPTNGTTTLTYYVTGDTTARTLNFDVPTVTATKATTPEPEKVTYTVEYYLEKESGYDKMTPDYTVNGEQETVGQITIQGLYEAGFENVPTGYELDRATLDFDGVEPGEHPFTDGQVFKLYYKVAEVEPEKVSYTVNYFLEKDYGYNKMAPDYTVNGEQETVGQITIKDLYEAGFENVPAGYELDRATLDFDGVAPGEHSFTDGQVFNLYYKLAPIPMPEYTVEYYLKDSDTDKYEVKYSETFQAEFGEVTIAALKAAWTENVPEDVKLDAYVLDEDMLAEGYDGIAPGTHDFKEDGQVFKLYYKLAEVEPEGPFTYWVKHIYMNGMLVDGVKDEYFENVEAGTKVVPAELNTYLDYTVNGVKHVYQVEKLDPDVETFITENDQVFTIYYQRNDPTPEYITVTVNYVEKDNISNVLHNSKSEQFELVGGVAAYDVTGLKFNSLTKGGTTYSYDSADAALTGKVESDLTITLYYKAESNTPVNPPVGPTVTYYSVTVNYYDKASGETIHTPYTDSKASGTTYDVTAQDKIAIEGYTYVETSGDALTGTLNGNKVINVYYSKTTDIDDGDTPTTPAEPGSDIGDDDVPTTPAQPPKTGDSMGLWIAAAMVSGMGLVWISLSGKKREEEV